MKNKHLIEETFIEAVNNYITAVNRDRIAYGLDESALWPFVQPVNEEYVDEELIYRLQAYRFPDNAPHQIPFQI